MQHQESIPTSASVDQLFSVAYEELRRLAAAVCSADPSATLNPTALVNEAYLKLARAEVSAVSRLHFKRIAARAMRQVLVEAARSRKALKRGGGHVIVTFDESLDAADTVTEEVLALDHSLHDLARVSPRQARMIEYRYFGGLDVAETAELLGVSVATVARDWRAARAWLAAELNRARQ